MKRSKFSIVQALLKGMFRGRNKQQAAMEAYLQSVPTIQRLIDSKMLGINLKERFVMIDESLHRSFMPRRFTPGGIDAWDRRYAAFFDKLVAFMNIELGRMGKPFIDPTTEPLNFSVVMPVMRYFDDDMNPLPAHLQLEYRTLQVGRYLNGEIEYASVD